MDVDRIIKRITLETIEHLRDRTMNNASMSSAAKRAMEQFWRDAALVDWDYESKLAATRPSRKAPTLRNSLTKKLT